MCKFITNKSNWYVGEYRHESVFYEPGCVFFAGTVVQVQLAETFETIAGAEDKISTVCTLTSLAAKGVINTRDYVETQHLTEKAEVALANALTDIFFLAQQESQVSFDDLTQDDVTVTMLALVKEYDRSAKADLASVNETDTAGTEDAPKEEWSSFDYARTALSVASVADPTGVLGVAAAYTYPKCGAPEAETGVSGFCWRDSEPRGAGWIPNDLGRVADCPSGFTNMGLTCQSGGHTYARSRPADCPSGYTNNGLTCGRGGDTISAPSRLANCPSGFTNMGLTCYRGPHSYGKACTTLWNEAPCKAGYTNMGCHCQRWAESRGSGSLTCPAGYFKGVAERCYKNCPSGYENTGEFCTKWPSTLDMSAMRCNGAGESLGGARCYTECKAGYTNTGEFCTKWPETRGTDAMTCKSGEFKSGARCYETSACAYTDNGQSKIGELQAGLCYEECNNKSFYGVGPVCWSSCNAKLKTECAAGCAESELECGLATTDMVLSPVEVAVSVVSLGNYAAASAARKASMKAAREAAKEAGKAAAKEGAERLAKIAGRELAKEAAEKLARESVDALDEELFEALIRYGDEIVDGAKDAGKGFDDALAEIDDVLRDLDDLAVDFAGDLDELDDIAKNFDDLAVSISKDIDAAQPLINRMKQGIVKAGKRAADESTQMSIYLNENSKKLVEVAKQNVFEPVKKAKDYVPNQLRKRSEIFDGFMKQKDALGKKWYVASARLVRSCAGLGITISEDVQQ